MISCNGVLWRDDSQIVHWVARKKIDKANPRTEVRVWLVEDGDE
jgi:Holliday junction resolvase RusA-like endonuclease